MTRRNKHRPGQWLVEDEVTGLWHYSSEITRDYLGRLVNAKTEDKRNMQDFVAALRDGGPVPFMHIADPVPEPNLCLPDVVAMTSAAINTDSPGYRVQDVGIGDMSVGSTFCVR